MTHKEYKSGSVVGPSPEPIQHRRPTGVACLLLVGRPMDDVLGALRRTTLSGWTLSRGLGAWTRRAGSGGRRKALRSSSFCPMRISRGPTGRPSEVCWGSSPSAL
jgi:hypothetical protein